MSNESLADLQHRFLMRATNAQATNGQDKLPPVAENDKDKDAGTRIQEDSAESPVQ